MSFLVQCCFWQEIKDLRIVSCFKIFQEVIWGNSNNNNINNIKIVIKEQSDPRLRFGAFIKFLPNFNQNLPEISALRDFSNSRRE